MRRQVYHGRVIDLGVEPVVLPNGMRVDLEIVRHRGAAAVVAIDDANRVVLIRQFRHAAAGFIWELPGGLLDHPGESPADCASRELAEETGLRAGEMVPLGAVLTTPGFTDERIQLFLARELRQDAHDPERDEVIAEVARTPLPEALAMIRRGDIVDAKTICGLHLAAAVLEAAP
jgi:ADP-ribose pyrophosphatase